MLLAGVLASPASAQTWQGDVSTDWTVGGNWGSNTPPTGAFGVIINNANPAVLGVTGPSAGVTASLVVSAGAQGTVIVQNGSTLTSTVGTIGQGGRGTVTVTGAGSEWTMSGQLTVGNLGQGTLYIQDGATVTANGGTRLGVNASSSGSISVTGAGVLETTGLTDTAADGNAQITLDGGTLRALANNAAFSNLATDKMTIGAGGLTFDTNSFAVTTHGFSGTGGLTTTGTGSLTLDGVSTYSGDTHVGTGSTLALTGAGAVASSRIIANGTFDVSGIAGPSFATSFLGGNGTVVLGTKSLAAAVIAPGNSIGTLTVAGDFTSNGGVLQIEAVLGDDASPADQLVITGNSLLGSGPTTVNVVNLGGLGAATTQGIKIVDVQGGTADAGAFVLGGPVIGGAYTYQLFQNGLVPDPANDGDWFLRNSGVLAPTTPVLENYPVALLALMDVPSLRQRTGETEDAGDNFWTRLEGGAAHFQAAGSNTNAAFDSSYFLAQLGFETPIVQSAAGMLSAGINAQLSRHYATVSSAFGNGSSVSESLGLGATLTWRGAEGFYADLQGQFAGFSTDLTAIGYKLVDDNWGTGYSVSLEVGQKLPLGGNWSITPQTQLSYASVGFSPFTDTFGSSISLDSGDSLVGRVGLAVDYAAEDSTRLYGLANLTYEFLDGATVVVSGTPLAYSAQKFGAELGIGGNVQLSDALTLEGEVSGFSSFAGSYGAAGKLGLTGTF